MNLGYVYVFALMMSNNFFLINVFWTELFGNNLEEIISSGVSSDFKQRANTTNWMNSTLEIAKLNS